MKNNIALFQGQSIRKIHHNGEWYFSVVDVVGVLIEQADSQKARKYWNKLSQRLREEGSEVVTICHRLKLRASDGKLRESDCANTEGIFRIIQSIPSKKAEPFKLWLAKVGKERIDEIQNPELAQARMIAIYEKKGYSKAWIDTRIRGMAVRESLTDEWKDRGVEESIDFAILTNDIMEEAFDLDVAEYKELKNLEKENLRDHTPVGSTLGV